MSELQKLPPGESALVPVLLQGSRQVQVQAKYLHLVGPLQVARTPLTALFLVEAVLHHPSSGERLPLRLVVDTGCQLPGVLSTEFVQRHAIPVRESFTRVRVANGQVVADLPCVRAQTHWPDQ